MIIIVTFRHKKNKKMEKKTIHVHASAMPNHTASLISLLMNFFLQTNDYFAHVQKKMHTLCTFAPSAF